MCNRQPLCSEQAKIEVRTLRKLATSAAQGAAGDARHIVKLLDYFSWEGHMCIVFERLSHSLYDVCISRRSRGIGLFKVRDIALQIVSTLEFLDRTGTIHADLKPENILLDFNSKIKVIDFGSALSTDGTIHFKGSYIQSRWYRSPEVFLGLPFNTKVDMWSLGCILVELVTGSPLFAGGSAIHASRICQMNSSHSMLLEFVQLLGPIPDSMVEASKEAAKAHVDLRDTLFCFQLKRSATKECAQKMLASVHIVPRGDDQEHWDSFWDFITGLLRWSPVDRPDPLTALKHPFLRIRRIEESRGEDAGYAA